MALNRRSFDYQAWLFIFPALLLLVVFIAIPLLQTGYLSTFKGNIIYPAQQFVGLDNYTRLLTSDPQFLDLRHWPPRGALVNTLIWIVFFPALTVSIGMFGVLISDGSRAERAFKSIIFIPMAISATAASVIFRFVYAADPNIGMLNAVLSGLSDAFMPVAWLGERAYANFAVIIAAVWIWAGLAITILSAAYKSLPQEVIDAARIDGARRVKRFFLVELPLLRAPVIFLIFTLMINALKKVDLILVLTEGGPFASTRVLGFTVYWEYFNNSRVGYGSAAAVLLLICVMPFIILQVRTHLASRKSGDRP
jgi:alpha-glucoside transport system permease protein